jgi:hypothetical protein
MKKVRKCYTTIRTKSLVTYQRLFKTLSQSGSNVYTAGQISRLLLNKHPDVFRRVDIDDVKKTVSAALAPSNHRRARVVLDGIEYKFSELVERVPHGGIGNLMGYRYVGPQVAVVGYCEYETSDTTKTPSRFQRGSTTKPVLVKTQDVVAPVAGKQDNTPSFPLNSLIANDNIDNNVHIRIENGTIYLSNLKGRPLVIEAA